MTLRFLKKFFFFFLVESDFNAVNKNNFRNTNFRKNILYIGLDKI